MTAAHMPLTDPGTLRKNILQNHRWACIFLKHKKNDEPNAILNLRIQEEMPYMYVASSLISTLRRHSVASQWISMGLKTAKVPVSGLPPGYYLFHSGEVIGFHAAIPTQDEIVWSALTGLGMAVMNSWVSGEPPDLQHLNITDNATMRNHGPGCRAFQYFRLLVANTCCLEVWETTQLERRQTWIDLDPVGADRKFVTQEWERAWNRAYSCLQEKTNEEEFQRACNLLNVDPKATQKQLTRSYRTLLKPHQTSPRLPIDGPMMNALNTARDLYKARRGWT